EIEAAVTEQPGVREAVVLARSDRSGGSDRSLVAYLVGEELDAAALRAALGRRLPDYMVPTAFVFLAALPLTGHGKVDRRALPAPDAATPAAATGPPPRDLLERFLAGQFHDVLALPAERELGVGESFFDLGGTSITTAIFTHRLQEALGETVHVVAIFDHPTVASLAAFVRESHPVAARRLLEGGEAAGPAVGRGILTPIQTGSPDRRPLFCVHSVGGEVVAYHEMARLLGPEQPVWGLQAPDPPLEEVVEMAEQYVAAMRSVQPRGPYRIAGWSMGGIVAFEMARQLEAQGQTTEVLAMIDVMAPAHWTEEAELTSAELMILFATALEQIYQIEIPEGVELPAVDLDSLDTDAALAIALDLGRQVGLLPASLEPVELRRIFERYRANRLSLRTYFGPYSYGGDLQLFRASEGYTSLAEDPALGWGPLVGGELRIFHVPGTHRSIMRQGIAAMAAHLRELFGDS
ncbi:MAG TPA: thioesterase domain-containing protein, partial [Thermoanaerobaculia bacterium]